MEELIWIPGNVPSSKNGKQYVPALKIAVNKPAVRKYLQKLGVKKYSCTKNNCYVENYKTRPNLFLQAFKDVDYQRPDGFCYVGMHFVREKRGTWDLNNISQIIMDLLTAHRFIKDDDINHAIVLPLNIGGLNYSVDSKNPGVFLYLTYDYEACFREDKRVVRR